MAENKDIEEIKLDLLQPTQTFLDVETLRYLAESSKKMNPFQSSH